MNQGKKSQVLPIAIDDGMDYQAVTFTMEAGDVAVMYTDGINESMNATDELSRSSECEALWLRARCDGD